MTWRVLGSITIGCLLLTCAAAAPKPRKALIIDGRNNHDWKSTTPVLKKYLEETGLFTVEVLTAPADNEALKSFKPEFGAYAVIVLNYNDFGPKNAGDWPAETQTAFVEYVRKGGGVVSYHAADNAFPEWPAYNLGTRPTYRIDVQCSVVNNRFGAEREMWEKVLK